MPLALNRNDYTHVTGSMGPQSPLTSTPIYTPSLHGFRDDPEPSLGISSRSDPPPAGITSTAKVQNNTTGPSPSLNQESKPQPASEFRPSAVPDDLPMPTLPDGLFQGLQEAIQARQLRSQRNEVTQEVAQRPDEGIAASLSAEKSIASRPSPVKLNLDSRGFVSKSKVETTSSRLQEVSASKRTQGPVSFQGGLFDDDDDDLDEMRGFLSKEVTLTPEDRAKKIGENQSSPLTGPLTSGGSSSMVRKGLFDDFGDMSTGSPSEAEVGAASSGLVERAQQSVLSLPDRKDANRSRVLKKSLFGDSDEEDNDLFGD